MDKLVLTADQIYALAFVLKAKYLDYYYISLSDRGNDDKLWLSDNVKKLVSQGILVEDFSGDVSIDSEIESLIAPIFFSTKESSLDIDTFGTIEKNIGYRFHFFDERITMTKTVEGGFEIAYVSIEEIRNIVSAILPQSYSCDSLQIDKEFDVSTVSCVFVVKNIEMNVKSYVATFIESEGVVYEENTENVVFSVSRTDFVEKLYRILAEV